MFQDLVDFVVCEETLSFAALLLPLRYTACLGSGVGYLVSRSTFPSPFLHHLQIYTYTINFSLISARLLGFDDYIPAYAGASNDQLLTGVNFASAAAGIRDETGQQLVRTHTN